MNIKSLLGYHFALGFCEYIREFGIQAKVHIYSVYGSSSDSYIDWDKKDKFLGYSFSIIVKRHTEVRLVVGTERSFDSGVFIEQYGEIVYYADPDAYYKVLKILIRVDSDWLVEKLNGKYV